MLSDFLTNKWILGGVGFLIVFTVACMLWYQYDTAPYRKETVLIKKLLYQDEMMKKESYIDSKIRHTTNLPLENTTPITEEIIPDTAAVVLDSDTNTGVTNILNTKSIPTTEAVEERRVSPFGFGLYPDLPPGFPEDYWESRSKTRVAELLGRVRIKLVEQGENVIGLGMRSGLAFPTIPGRIYVEWKEVGTERYVANMMGDLSALFSLPNYSPGQELTEKDIPVGIEVIDYPNGGIDPYEFLGLH